MRPTVRSRLSIALFALPLLVSPSPASSMAGRHLTLVGNDDAALDRASLQAAIAAAARGSILELAGTWQLDGQPIHITTWPLTLRGVALDNDGDGEVNEDWGDGSDNDGDGHVDEDDWDTVIRGVANPDGTPAEDVSPAQLFNRGFLLQGVSGTARRITIRDLRFEDHNRAITIQPEVSAPTNLCADIVPTGGSAAAITLRDNLFVNNNRSIQVLGVAEDVDIARNVFLDTRNGDLFLQGGLIGCTGGIGIAPLGTPRRLRIAHNTLIHTTVGMFARLVQDLRIQHNDVDVAALGISVRQSEDVTVQQNRVAGAVLGIVGTQPAVNVRYLENTVVDSRNIAVVLQNTSSGYLVKNNHISGSATADVFLDATTTGNVVIVEPDDTIVDLGTGNQIIVRSGGE